jgi:aromatic ring-opening dioxygenase catalytic subunit (LigB family)
MITEHLMPSLFIGHGNPMNAIEETFYAAAWRTAAASIPRPKAILCISAHWETEWTFATAMTQPRTIHDFFGFPDALFQVQYPAPGSPELAERVRGLVRSTTVELDNEWGLDHGAWAVEFDQKSAELILAGEHGRLVAYPALGEAARFSIPTNEHYLPLLYILALQQPGEPVSFFAEGLQLGSISMRSVRIGA